MLLAWSTANGLLNTQAHCVNTQKEPVHPLPPASCTAGAPFPMLFEDIKNKSQGPPLQSV